MQSAPTQSASEESQSRARILVTQLECAAQFPAPRRLERRDGSTFQDAAAVKICMPDLCVCGGGGTKNGISREEG
jgi:hypothetical protein